MRMLGLKTHDFQSSVLSTTTDWCKRTYLTAGSKYIEKKKVTKWKISESDSSQYGKEQLQFQNDFNQKRN